MSDITRYEKELAQELKKLPLPNEDAAWDDMSKLLDKDNDRGGIPPNRGNIVWGSLIGALLIGALLFFVYKRSTDTRLVNNQTTSNNVISKDDQKVNNANSVSIDKITNTEAL